jgi:hypothetical protein
VDIFLAFPGFGSGKALFFMGKKGKKSVRSPIVGKEFKKKKNIYFMVKWLAYYLPQRGG